MQHTLLSWGVFTSFAVIAAPLARGQANLVDLASEGRFSSAMYDSGVSSDSVHAGSLAAWDAMGRHGVSDTGALPTSPFFDRDLARAWSSFDQSSAQATLRSFAQSSGYYFNDGGVTYARTNVKVHNTVLIQNLGSSPVMFQATFQSHGTLLSGGNANDSTAYAAETYSVDLFDSSVLVLSKSWSGSASVYAHDSVPTVSVVGDWAGSTSSIQRSVPNFSDPFNGIELSALFATSGVLIPAGGQLIAQVSLDGTYRAESSQDSGFLSMAQVDFSATGLMGYAAYDPDTGAASTAVTFSLVDVPSPGAALVLLGLPLFSDRRRR